MEILFIVLGYLILNVNSSNTPCQDLIIQPFVTCYEYIQSCYILEGDEEDYQKLQQINTQIIKPSFIIPFQEQPIVIIIIDSFDEKKKIQEKLLCSLIRKLEYSIVCISLELVQQEEQINFSEKFRFDTNIVGTEFCDEMDTKEDGNLNLFCLNQFTLTQYTIHLSKRNVTLILKHDFQDQIQDSCKIKQMKWNENQYIVVFYQCSNWKILLIKNGQLDILYDAAQLNDNNTLFQGSSFINDVSFCLHNQLILTIYLIENDTYYYVQLNSDQNLFVNYFSFQNTTHILKIIIQPKCQIIIVVNQLQENNQKFNGFSISNQINLNFEYSNNNIHFHSNILFLQNQTQLTVFLNANLNQTFQISNTSLHFFEFDKLFCQFDQSKNALQFYRYFQLKSVIQPKQKYLYLIQSKYLFKNNALYICLRIIYENNTKEEKQQLVQQITVQNICQSKLQQRIWKSEALIQFKDSTFNLYNSEGSINVSIRNSHKFQDSCLQKLQLFNFIGNIEMRQIKLPDFLCFQNETTFYIYDCTQNKLLISINRQQFEVLESYGDYFIVSKKNQNFLRIFQFKNGQLFQFKIELDAVIIKTQQISQSVFLYTNNTNQAPIIYYNFQLNLIRQYLSKNLYQSEPILFYYEVENLKFIQYINIIAIEIQGKIRIFKFKDALIISIQLQTILHQDYLMFSIQNLTQSLILNYINDDELHQISNYTFSDYQFFYPFKYKINPEYLAILMMQNKNLYIAIFQHNKSFLHFQEIIATDNSFFTFYQNDLLYFLDGEWRYLLLNEIQFELEANFNFKNNLSSLFQTDLYLNKQDERGIQLKIQIYNSCYKLQQIKNLSLLEIQQNQNLKLNISDIFYGPINSLTLITNSSIVLNGPFQFIKKFQLCSKNNRSNFCIKKYKIQKEPENLRFSAIILENQQLDIVNIDFNFNLIYITQLKQNYYLSFLQSESYLKIQLIQCSELNDEDCIEISDHRDNFQIKSNNALDIMRTGNLIMLQDEFNQTFIYFEDINFIQIQIPFIILDVKYIEESQNQYLILQQNKINSIDIVLIIYQINLDQKRLLYQLSIYKELQIEMTNRQQSFQELKLTSCVQIGSLTKITLFIISQQFSYLFQLIFDQQKNQITFELLKSIRNCVSSNEKFKFEYFDENILILKSIRNNMFQFYDLREERNYYDYFHKSRDSLKIKQINTTSYLFFNRYSSIYLGTFGYEIEQQNSSEINYHFELYAQNDISDEKTSFQIHVIIQKHQFTKTLILIQLSCFIFIIIYLRNNKSRTQKQFKRNKTIQVFQIRDI